MKRFLETCFVILFLLLLVTPRSEAHVGGGPPFLKVNDKYAKTNPYFQGEAAFNVTQDLAPEKYPVSIPVHLEVDTTQLLIPPDVAAHSTFRWTLATGDLFTDLSKSPKFGKAIDYTFPKVGSYLIILEAHAADETEFAVIDTIQLDIYKDSHYIFPKSAVNIFLKSNADSNPVTFISNATLDPSVKSVKDLWDLGDGKLKTGRSVQADYSGGQPLSYMYHRIIDDHGFVNDMGIDVWDTKKKIEFHPFGNMTEASFHVTIGAQPAPSKNQTVRANRNTIVFLLGIPALVLILLFLSVLRRKK